MIITTSEKFGNKGGERKIEKEEAQIRKGGSGSRATSQLVYSGVMQAESNIIMNIPSHTSHSPPFRGHLATGGTSLSPSSPCISLVRIRKWRAINHPTTHPALFR